jgi:hypothetical protein
MGEKEGGKGRERKGEKESFFSFNKCWDITPILIRRKLES